METVVRKPVTARAEAAEAQVARRRGLGAATVYTAIKNDILNMTLAPGVPLDETSLSRRFGMSRTPIREALARLVAEGLANTLPNRNTVVSTIDFLGMPAYLDALTLMYRVSTRLAAERRTEADLAVMREQQEQFAKAVLHADALAMLETNRQFHLAIAVAGGNKYYVELFSRLLNEGMRVLRAYYLSFEDQLPKEYVDEHEGIVAAIEARDVEVADELARQHALQIVKRIETFIAPTFGAALALNGSVRR
jgi:DNA-binding GntR family transcriptional regulator